MGVLSVFEKIPRNQLELISVQVLPEKSSFHLMRDFCLSFIKNKKNYTKI